MRGELMGLKNEYFARRRELDKVIHIFISYRKTIKTKNMLTKSRIC